MTGQPTYVDILRRALASASLDTQGRFLADSRRWHRFVERAKAAYPEVFRQVKFDRREPDAPYSDQAAHALHVLAQAGVLSVGNPSFRYMMMDGHQREIAQTKGPDLSGDDEATVTRVAELAKSMLVEE